MRRLLFAPIILNLVLFGILTSGQFPWLNDWVRTLSGRVVFLPLLAVSFGGILFFIVDAFRREYDQERPLAVALALFGFISLGLGTVFYYLRWGWQPAKLEYSDQFCNSCLESSSEYPNFLMLSTLEYVIGGRLVGQSKKCDKCGSTLRTHCFYLCGIPVYSAGTFRVQVVTMNQYLLRKCKQFYRPHLMTILLMPLVIALFVLMVILIDQSQK